MYTLKTIRITIQLQSGEFEGGGNQITIEGLPVTVTVQKQGGDQKNTCSVEVSGLKLTTVRQLTMLAFKRLETYNNILQVEAGDKSGKLSLVFQGEITSSVPAISDNGDLRLKIEAMAGYYASLLPQPPVSVQGDTTVEKLMKQFAEEAGYKFVNNGISGSVSNCVFIGSPVKKAQTLARQVGIDLLINDGTFTIQEFNAPKQDEIPLINKEHGLLGYPSYSNDGIECRSLFNPAVEVGKYFRLESILPLATGEWQVVQVEHRLDAYTTSGGAWETNIKGVLPDGGEG